MDATTRVLVDLIEDAGFDVQVNVSNGCHLVEAVDLWTREQCIVTGDNPYRAVVDLARQVRIAADASRAVRRAAAVGAAWLTRRPNERLAIRGAEADAVRERGRIVVPEASAAGLAP